MQRQCIRMTNGTVCGYDCKKGQYGKAPCARYPSQQCMVDQFGKVHCSYNYMKSQKGNVKCARSYLDNCVKNSYGQIRCGQNCRATVVGIRCRGNTSY